MGECFISRRGGVGGGGAGLNVVTGLSEPGSPKENMIWVKSDKAGKKYVFSKAEPPSPSEGLIWFKATNAGIITRTNVYTGGAWVMVDTYMYLGGNWTAISTAYTYLFTSGSESDYTITKYVDRRASIEIEKEKIAINSISTSAEGYIGGVLNIGPFDATNLKTLYVDMEYLTSEPHYSDFRAAFGVSQSEWTNYNTHLVNNCVKFGENVFPRKTVALDIQAFSGELYFVWNGAGVANIFNIWAK